MAGKLKPLNVEAPEAAEEAEGQAKSLKPEDVLAMVIKLQKEGSLEPQIEDLISRINELQQAKKKSSEELRETHTLWEALHRELDSLNGEKVHLEEVLSKKQEALRILQMHCQEKERKAQRLDVKGQLEDLMGQHKDLWEFHMLEQRLAREIRALERSKEQLLSERRLVRAKLGEVERRLRSPPEVEGARAVNDGLKAELEIFGEQVQSAPEVGAGKGEILFSIRSVQMINIRILRIYCLPKDVNFLASEDPLGMALACTALRLCPYRNGPWGICEAAGNPLS
nr:synaptonemal complex central element protein 1-like isoform X1 [Pongo pygmaeus]